MSKVMKHEPEIQTPGQAVAPISETSAILSVIERAALNPNVDIDKMERLLEMQERVMARNAKGAYAAALAKMQQELPVITERGRIEVRDKSDRNKVIQSTSYARWEDINEAIKPVLAKHGFALSFRTGLAADGRIMVTGILSHEAGHQEETTMVLPHDSTGSKNAVQAVGSSTSYGKRYTAGALLNLTSRGEDDDGKSADAPALVSEEQALAINDMIEAVGANRSAFLKHIKVDRIEDIRADKFDAVLSMLKRKGEAK